MRIKVIPPLILVATWIVVHQQYMNVHEMNPILHFSIKLLPYIMIGLILTHSVYQKHS